jgi:hypothetical protein
MTHVDLNKVFDTVVSFAKLMLSEQDEFYPFGATMSADGEITNIGAAVEGGDHPASQVLIDLIAERFRQQATKREIRAAAICYDARTIPPGQAKKTDAICCGLEHRLGESIDVFIPYTKMASGHIQYGETFAAKRSGIFFSGPLV